MEKSTRAARARQGATIRSVKRRGFVSAINPCFLGLLKRLSVIKSVNRGEFF
jgi:hypothetical protein